MVLLVKQVRNIMKLSQLKESRVMERFNNFRNYLSNINSSVLLAVGLLIVAGLIAATFIYGEDNDTAGNNETNNEVAETSASNEENSEDNSTEVSNDSDEGTTNSDNEENSEAAAEAPTELADTGPTTSALAIMSLSTAGYFYRRSQKNLDTERLSQ